MSSVGCFREDADTPRSIHQMSILTASRLYARLFPFFPMARLVTCSPEFGIGVGEPPSAEILHNVKFPPRLDENTISRPSTVHASFSTARLSKVNRFSSPPADGIV